MLNHNAYAEQHNKLWKRTQDQVEIPARFA